MIKLIKYSDPGHGWYKVSRKLINRLGIVDKISAFSYQHGDNVYLEEDCDIAILLKALFPHASNYHDLISVKDNWTNRQSKIRNYASYSPNYIPAPKLTVGLKFKLYGKDFEAVRHTGKNWIVKDQNETQYKLKKSQEKEIAL